MTSDAGVASSRHAEVGGVRTHEYICVVAPRGMEIWVAVDIDRALRYRTGGQVQIAVDGLAGGEGIRRPQLRDDAGVDAERAAGGDRTAGESEAAAHAGDGARPGKRLRGSEGNYPVKLRRSVHLQLRRRSGRADAHAAGEIVRPSGGIDPVIARRCSSHIADIQAIGPGHRSSAADARRGDQAAVQVGDFGTGAYGGGEIAGD